MTQNAKIALVKNIKGTKRNPGFNFFWSRKCKKKCLIHNSEYKDIDLPGHDSLVGRADIELWTERWESSNPH